MSWSADFKGWFRTGDGVRCEPLTVTDGYSRYILGCEAVPQVTFARVQPVLRGLFRDHGLPRALRTDNGNPFARSDALGGLSRLSVWLLTLDVWPDFILPGRPDMNGRHERMHRVLREDTVSPAAASVLAQQERFDAWRADYNSCRPHEALGQRYPASLYRHVGAGVPGNDYGVVLSGGPPTARSCGRWLHPVAGADDLEGGSTVGRSTRRLLLSSLRAHLTAGPPHAQSGCDEARVAVSEPSWPGLTQPSLAAWCWARSPGQAPP